MNTFYINFSRNTVHIQICSMIAGQLLDAGRTWTRNSPSLSIYAHSNRASAPFATAFLMQMHVRNLWTLDENGWGIAHSQHVPSDYTGSVTNVAAKDFCDRIANRMFFIGESKWVQDEPETIRDAEPFVLVPLQVPTDSVVVNSGITVNQFLADAIAWANLHSTRIAIKIHPKTAPADRAALEATITAALGPYVHHTRGNISRLLRYARGCITLNSGVGFEAMIHGKPVVTVGPSDYQYAACQTVLNANSVTLFNTPPAPLMNKQFRFVWHYFNERGYYIETAAGINRLRQRITDLAAANP